MPAMQHSLPIFIMNALQKAAKFSLSTPGLSEYFFNENYYMTELYGREAEIQ